MNWEESSGRMDGRLRETKLWDSLDGSWPSRVPRAAIVHKPTLNVSDNPQRAAAVSCRSVVLKDRRGADTLLSAGPDLGGHVIDSRPLPPFVRHSSKQTHRRDPSMSDAAIHTEHLSHAFTLSRDIEPVVVLEDINISLPHGSRTILVCSPGSLALYL